MSQNKEMLENHVIKPSVFIEEQGEKYWILPTESEMSLDSKIAQIEKFITNNHGYGRPEEEKDYLYEEAKNLWRDFTTEFKETVYTFYLNKKQYDYITNLLKNDLDYDVNTVFFAVELVKLIGTWESEGFIGDYNVKGYLADATETTYIYHILAKHTVKGITEETHRFSEILLKIGEISKIVSYYDTHAKSLSKAIQDWVASFDDIESTNLQQEPQF